MNFKLLLTILIMYLYLRKSLFIMVEDLFSQGKKKKNNLRCCLWHWKANRIKVFALYYECKNLKMRLFFMRVGT